MRKITVEIKKYKAGISSYGLVDAEALIKGFLEKLPDPRLVQPKVNGDILASEKMFNEVAEGLVTDVPEVSYVRAEVELDDLINPALAIFVMGRAPSDQNEGSIFVYQKLKGQWVDKTPSDDLLGHKHCLRVHCGDDLNTVLVIHRSDPVWKSFVLYPESYMCKAWLKLNLLLHPQDGAAITSLLRSKEGPVCGHTTRIVRSLEGVVALMNNELTCRTWKEVQRTAV